MIYKNAILSPGLLFSGDFFQTTVLVEYFSKQSFLNWNVSEQLLFSYMKEKTILDRNINTLSMVVDLSQKQASIPFIAKGGLHYSQVGENNGYSTYIQLGTPIHLFNLKVNLVLTKINWWWDESSSFVVDSGHFYTYSKHYTTLHNGENTDVLIQDYSAIYKIKQFNIFGRYSRFSHNGTRYIVIGGIETSFGLKNKSFFIRGQHDDQFKVVAGFTIKDALSL